MIHAKIGADGVIAYPLYLADIRRAHPEVSLPAGPSSDDLLALGYAVVSLVPQPEIDHTQDIRESAPEPSDSGWRQVWVVTPASPEQISERTQSKSDEVRAERNDRLAACDWTQLVDAPVDSLAWANYRQALRDVTAQPAFPWSVDWPTPPG
jgi:hypothetical protein